MAVVCRRRRGGEGRALLLLRRRLGVLLWVVEARGWRLRVGVVGCVVASLLVPVLRWWRRGARGAVGAWYGAWRLEALVRRRPVAVAVVGAHVLVLLRWWRHGFVVLRTAWRRAGVAVWIHELCCLLGFGVSGGRVSCQPFVARPVDVRMSSHDVAGSTSTASEVKRSTSTSKRRILTLVGRPGCIHGCRPCLVGTLGDGSGRVCSPALTEFTPLRQGRSVSRMDPKMGPLVALNTQLRRVPGRWYT